MSIEVMRYVWRHSKAKANNRLMLLAIADIANDTGDAYPGVDRLAEKCLISHRTAQDCIQELERCLELEVFENVGTKTKSGWTNLYRILMEGVEQSEVRTPDGEIAHARPFYPKKSRLFPKAMQTVAPLENDENGDDYQKGVQTVAPHDMQLVAPDGVQTVAPKPLVYTPVLNTSALSAGKERKPNPIFDAVCEFIFGTDPKTVTHEGGRIGPIAAWLGGKTDGMKRNGGQVGYISHPAEPEHIKRFASWYKSVYPNINMPLDFVKFVETWRKFATTNASPLPKKLAVILDSTEPTAAERAALEEARKNIRPDWKGNGTKAVVNE